MRLHAVSCPNCGASIPGYAVPRSVIVCDYCNSAFRVADSPTPQPELGDLLLGADFSDRNVPGWLLSTPEKLTFVDGRPPELRVDFEPTKLIHPIIRTPGYFADLDVSVTIRFMDGKWDYISAGFEIRSSDQGDYIFRLSAQGTFQVGMHTATEWGETLVSWRTHPALRTEVGSSNRLRVLARGSQLRLYLNGVLATSLNDERQKAGTVRVVVSPTESSNLVVAFQDLQLREPPSELA